MFAGHLESDNYGAGTYSWGIEYREPFSSQFSGSECIAHHAPQKQLFSMLRHRSNYHDSPENIFPTRAIS